MDRILINQLVFETCHGVLEAEKTEKQPFIFDIELLVDYTQAALRDDLSQTVSYAHVAESVEAVVNAGHCQLIEHLAYKTISAIFEGFEAIQAIELKLSKPQAPMPYTFESVAVAMLRTRDDWQAEKT